MGHEDVGPGPHAAPDAGFRPRRPDGGAGTSPERKINEPRDEEETMLPTMRRTNEGTGLRNISDLRYEMDRLFEDAFGGRSRSIAGWTPATNLVETDEAYEVSLELPGFDREDIEVTVDQGVLSISGERTEEFEGEERTYHLRERSVGRFNRSFSLPSSVSAESVSAKFQNGVLRVNLPKQEEARTRKIEVDVD